MSAVDLSISCVLPSCQCLELPILFSELQLAKMGLGVVLQIRRDTICALHVVQCSSGDKVQLLRWWLLLLILRLRVWLTCTVNVKCVGLFLQDLVNWIQDKQEVEIVDLVLRIREKIASASNNDIPITADMVNKLQCHMASIISTLPEDLQSVLRDGQS